MCTSNGVKGHFPSMRFAPGLITLPLLLNFPLQLLSRAISISCFSSSPPSYSQHEKATMSFEGEKKMLRNNPRRATNWFNKTDEKLYFFKPKMYWNIFSTTVGAILNHSINHFFGQCFYWLWKSQCFKIS